MAHIEFTDNYQDLSTQSGYQFKFICENCGNGYMSSFKASKAGMATGLLRGAGSLLGGVLGNASYSAEALREAVAGPAHDHALQDAVAEIRPLFVQCKRCGQWVCREICWNNERGLCSNCAPIVQRELGSIQAKVTIEQAEAKIRAQDLTGGINVADKAVVICPACGAENDGGKFCQECGSPLAARLDCPRCGTELKPNAKFCPECGNKMA
jgi:Double zinc ribbon